MTACGRKSDKGQLGDGTVDHEIGHSPEATLVGMGFGALLGYIVGTKMDKQDRQLLNRAYETGSPGQSRTWHNSDSGESYEVTPEPAFYPTPQSPCRRAEIVAILDGKKEKAYSTACRNSHGQWELR